MLWILQYKLKKILIGEWLSCLVWWWFQTPLGGDPYEKADSKWWSLGFVLCYLTFPYLYFPNYSVWHHTGNFLVEWVGRSCVGSHTVLARVTSFLLSLYTFAWLDACSGRHPFEVYCWVYWLSLFVSCILWNWIVHICFCVNSLFPVLIKFYLYKKKISIVHLFLISLIGVVREMFFWIRSDVGGKGRNWGREN